MVVFLEAIHGYLDLLLFWQASLDHLR